MTDQQDLRARLISRAAEAEMVGGDKLANLLREAAAQLGRVGEPVLWVHLGEMEATRRVKERLNGDGLLTASVTPVEGHVPLYTSPQLPAGGPDDSCKRCSDTKRVYVERPTWGKATSIPCPDCDLYRDDYVSSSQLAGRLLQLVNEYELDDDQGHHIPSDGERAMLLDFANGALSDELFSAMLKAHNNPNSRNRPATPQPDSAAPGGDVEQSVKEALAILDRDAKELQNYRIDLKIGTVSDRIQWYGEYTSARAIIAALSAPKQVGAEEVGFYSRGSRIVATKAMPIGTKVYASPQSAPVPVEGEGGEACGYVCKGGTVTFYMDGSFSRMPKPGTVLFTTPPPSQPAVELERDDG